MPKRLLCRKAPIHVIISISFFLFLFACQPKQTLIPEEGYISVKGGKVWYRIYGSGDKTPLLLLHGGPCVPSYYLNPLSALSKDRPVIFLDQLGCGRSDRITDTTLMNTKSYVEQLKKVTEALGLKHFYLYGQSWGTMLATDYYLKYKDGIEAVIFSSPCLSSPLWLRDADTLISTLPDSIQKIINENELNKTFSNPDYQMAVNIFYDNFLTRRKPHSKDMDSVYRNIGVNVYEYMWGPSEFTATGNLKNYDRTKDLNKIKVPVLFIAGEYDEARPSTVKYYQSLIKGAKFSLIKNAGHLTMQDNSEEDVKVISCFLNKLEE
jgi:proline iminopeptidase